MILLEGMLLVPPERGSLIGRAVWKVSDVLIYLLCGRIPLLSPLLVSCLLFFLHYYILTSNHHTDSLQPRYVVLGSSSPFKAQAALAEAAKSPGKLRSSKPSLVDVTQPDDNSELYISIYKSKVRNWIDPLTLTPYMALSISTSTYISQPSLHHIYIYISTY